MRKTRRQVLREFNLAGMSVSEWARKHRAPRSLVVYVLRGGRALRGKSHDIAVQLKIKEGIPRRQSEEGLAVR